MQLELIIIISSVILYSIKYHRLNNYKENYENSKNYTLNSIIIKK